MKSKLSSLLVLVVAALVLVWWLRRDGGPQMDEAMRAGKTPADFPQADRDYFQNMDGGVPMSAEEVKGRNTWLVWTGGNEAFWDWLANNSFGTFDLLKTLSSYPCGQPVAAGLAGAEPPAHAYYKRATRFHYLGLMNEPGFRQATKPDEYGLCLDEPTEPNRPPDFDEKVYGRASGVLGLRLYKNPNFDDAARIAWNENQERFYTDPIYYSSERLVRPYRVGMSCAFCHISHHPLHPPGDPENPQFADLSGTIGAQYFWFGRIFGANLTPDNFAWHLLNSQQPGAVDTSFIPTDYINNPRAMNAVFDLPARLKAATRFHQETSAGGALSLPEVKTHGSTGYTFGVPHILWDGADSVGVEAALERVYINIGEYHQEWIRHIRPIIGGKPQSPIEVRVAQQYSTYWNATHERVGNLAAYLIKAGDAMPLKAAPGGEQELVRARKPADYERLVTRGKVVFAETCARCHSSNLPQPAPGMDDGVKCAGSDYLKCWDRYWQWTQTEDFKSRMRSLVLADDFLVDNYLSTDARIPVTLLETEICSSMASNSLEGYVWDNFSSQSYKSLPALPAVTLHDPVTEESYEWPRKDGTLPGGGRGYQRVPSLISIWATAPFLHNNELGEFTNDPSTKGRMRAFDDAIHKLLWPATRDNVVRRTDRVSSLKVFTSALPGPLQPLFEESFLPSLLRKIFGVGTLVKDGALEIGPIPKGTPVSLLGNINLDFKDPRVDPAKLLDVLKDTKKRLKTIREQRLDDAQAAAVLTELVPKLRAISTCPDFRVDRGHNFGADLPDADKEALIEFVKTF